MKDYTEFYPGRKMRTFYTTSLKRVQGFDCGPDNPDYYWIPAEHSSQHVGTSLFEDSNTARARGIENLERQIREAQAALAELKTTSAEGE